MRESYYERRYWRLCFDGLRISQIPLNCHKLGNGNAPEVYIICVCKFFTQACSSCLCFDACIVYIRLRGAFRVARFDNSGMREPLSWERAMARLHAFYLMLNNHIVIICFLEAGKHGKGFRYEGRRQEQESSLT